MFFSFSIKNHAESYINFVKIQFLDTKRAKLDQNSDFRHVRTFSWLQKLRNTQGKIHGTYLGNIYGIYQECIRSIHRYLWEKIIRNTDPMGRPPSVAAPLRRRRRRRLCFWWYFLIDIYGYSLNIPDIFHICFLDVFHVFSLVCFLVYGVKRRSGHDGSQSFGSISHVSGPETSVCFLTKFLYVFCRRSSKIKLFCPKTLIFNQKSRKYQKNQKKHQKFLGFLGTPVETPVEIPVETPVETQPLRLRLRLTKYRIPCEGLGEICTMETFSEKKSAISDRFRVNP